MAEKRKTDSKTGVTPELKGPRLTGPESSTMPKTYAKVTADSIAKSLSEKAKISEGKTGSNVSSTSSWSRTNAFKGKDTGLERDQIMVDILQIDDLQFKDQLTEKEQNLLAMKLGIPVANLSGIAPGYANGHPTYTYRLYTMLEVSKINFNDIVLKRSTVNREGQKIKSEILCKARGASGAQRNQKKEEEGPIYRWVRVEDSRYKLDEEQLRTWFEHYGTLETAIEEATKVTNCGDFEDDSDLSETEKEYLREASSTEKGTGVLKVRMRIDRPMPQYLPMFGQKIRIYYTGVERTCTNCYLNGHVRRDCKNIKTQWINYVANFIDNNPEIPTEFYGRWAKIVEDEKMFYRNQNQQQPQNEPGTPIQTIEEFLLREKEAETQEQEEKTTESAQTGEGDMEVEELPETEIVTEEEPNQVDENETLKLDETKQTIKPKVGRPRNPKKATGEMKGARQTRALPKDRNDK